MINGTLVSVGPIVPADFPNLFRWADDVDAARLNEPYRPPLWKSQEEFWFNLAKDHSRIFFAIRKIGTQPIIGYAQVTQIDPVHRSCMLGLRIGDEAERGKGYGSDALRLAIGFCWNNLNLSRIGMTVFSNNERAEKIYSGFGFEREGVLRKGVFIDGRWLDVVIMSLLHPSR